MPPYLGYSSGLIDLFFFNQVADPRQVTLNTRELEREPKRFTVRHEVDIPVQVPSSAGEGQLEAAVVGPDQESVPSSVTKDDDGYYHIRFVPRQTGEHRVMVMYGGKEVSSSPYVIRIRDATSMKVKVTEMEQMRTGYSAQKEVCVIIIFVCLTFPRDEIVSYRFRFSSYLG